MRATWSFTRGVAVAAVTISCLSSQATATNEVEIVKVEETWELQVGNPNTVRNAPQVTMVMSPYVEADCDHFLFVLNHRTAPEYSVGGMQLQVWNDEEIVDHRNGPSGAALSTENETITWTQEMSVENGVVTMKIKDGTSQSWGDFGGQGYLQASIVTGQSTLNSYRPYVSLSESGISFAGNRVASLTLQRVRWTLSDGRVYQYVAPIDIDSDLDPWDEE